MAADPQAPPGHERSFLNTTKRTGWFFYLATHTPFMPTGGRPLHPQPDSGELGRGNWCRSSGAYL